jgi:membrane associated rhomboid family serine protease
MSRGSDLFVVCKQCGSEVSPYITECPYCGHRLRKRAPKLPRAKSRSGTLTRLVRRPSLARSTAPLVRGRIGRGSRHGDYARERRPYATAALVIAGAAGWLVVWAGYVDFGKLAIEGSVQGDWWKLISSQFAYVNGVYAFVAILATGLYGWLLERRRGSAIVLATFLGGGVTGALVASAVYADPIVSGANGAALALLGAWAVPDLEARRHGHYYDGDLLGTGAIALTLLALPYARPEASWLAGVAGGAVGLTVGYGLYLIDSPEH